MTPLVLLVCLGALVSAAPKVFYDLENAETYFEDFIQNHDKQYSNEAEKKMRFEIFKKNLAQYNEDNMKPNSHSSGITRFSDLTIEEFKATYLGHHLPSGPSPCTGVTPNVTSFAAPDSFDWRDAQKVTAVKDQGQCGSCWTFSTTGNIEGQYAIVHNELKEFSEKQLLDCSTSNNGCDGGLMSTAILYVQQAGGIMTENDYPYQPVQGNCQFNPSAAAAQVKGCNVFQLGSEDELKETLYTTGPLAISLDADNMSGYRGGIFRGCQQGTNNHAVLLVGYGSDGSTPFWIIKNSWGVNWGEAGYIKLPRNQNACNIMGPQSLIVSAVVA